MAAAGSTQGSAPGSPLLGQEPSLPEPGSPQVQAAMRVLGILPQELEKREMDDYDHAEPRYGLFESKRRTLVGQVGDLASKSPEDVQVMDTTQERNAAFMAKVLEAEKRNMDAMALKAKKDVQKVVLEELETKLILHRGAKKLEESNQRVKVMKKEQDARLAALKKEAQKRAEKTADVRKRAEKRLEEESVELNTKLGQASDRAEQKMAEIAAGRVAARVAGEERRTQVNERTASFEQSLTRQRERQYDAIVQKHEAKQRAMQEVIASRQSKSEAIKKKHEECMEHVKQHWEKRQDEADENYHRILEKHKAAEEKREADLTAKVKEYATKNNKERSGFANRYERLQKDWEDHCKEVYQRAHQSGDSKGFDRSLSESQLAALRMRGYHRELVAANRSRLSRAHHHAQEQQLSKIEAIRQRVDFLQQSKETSDIRRTVMVRNCAVQKHHLNHEVFKVQSSPAEKMVNLVREMEPEPEAAARIHKIMSELGLEKLLGSTEEGERA